MWGPKIRYSLGVPEQISAIRDVPELIPRNQYHDQSLRRNKRSSVLPPVLLMRKTLKPRNSLEHPCVYLKSSSLFMGLSIRGDEANPSEIPGRLISMESQLLQPMSLIWSSTLSLLGSCTADFHSPLHAEESYIHQPR